MDITEIDETDPMKLLVEIDKVIRPPSISTGLESGQSHILSYYNKLQHAAQGLGIIFEANLPDGKNSSDWQRFFDAIVGYIDKLKINLLLENSNKQTGVALDQPWRQNTPLCRAYKDNS